MGGKGSRQKAADGRPVRMARMGWRGGWETGQKLSVEMLERLERTRRPQVFEVR